MVKLWTVTCKTWLDNFILGKQSLDNFIITLKRFFISQGREKERPVG